MRNVNFKAESLQMLDYNCFILTMRNVNDYVLDNIKTVTDSFILTMRNVN